LLRAAKRLPISDLRSRRNRAEPQLRRCARGGIVSAGRDADRWPVLRQHNINIHSHIPQGAAQT
jgi:hypothetical protein